MLGNADQKWIVGIVQTGLMTMTVRLWMLLCLATPYKDGSWNMPNWPTDHAKAMDDHRTATAQGYALVTQQLQRGLVGLLEVRITPFFFLSGHFLPYIAQGQ